MAKNQKIGVWKFGQVDDLRVKVRPGWKHQIALRIGEAAVVETMLESVQVSWLVAGLVGGHFGLLRKLGFRDWLFLGEIEKTAWLAAGVARDHSVMGAPYLN